MSKEDLTPFTKDDNRASEAGKKSRRGRSLSTVIRELIECEYDTPEELKSMFPKDKYTGAELATMAMIVKSTKGDVQAFNAWADRLEGRPKMTVDTTITERHQLPEGLTKKQLMKLAELGEK